MDLLNTDEQDSRDMIRLAGGQNNALNDLMERHSQRIYHFLLRSLRHEEDASDLAQETFFRIYQNSKKFDAKQKFTTWMYAIATNLVRDRFRWRSRHPELSMDAETAGSDAPLGHTFASSGATPDEAMQTAERTAIIRKAVAALPDELREPLILVVYERLSQTEIAAVLGCSTKAVENRIYRARNGLRERLGALIASM